MCIFLTNVLQNLRKRISAKLQDGGTKHGHTLSQPAHNVGQPSARQRNPFKCFRCCIAKKEERKAGKVPGGVETHSIFVVSLHVLLLFLYGLVGGGKLLI